MISLSSPVETRAHGWPAAAKLLALCAATLVLFRLEEVATLAACLVLLLLLYALPGKVFFKTGLGRLRMLWPFVTLLVIWHIITADAALGVALALRMIVAVGLANLVTMTTRLSDMMAVIVRLFAPFGRYSRVIGLAMALVIRFTPVLVQKGQGLSSAWRARSPRRPGWRVIVPFLALALDDADHVAEALRARGGL